MGSEPDVVNSTYGTHGPKSKATVSSSLVLGRLPDMFRQGREGSQYEGLPEGDTGDRQASLIIRIDAASDEEGMGREYSGVTPWLRDRLGSHKVLHSAAKIAKVYGIARAILRQARQGRRWVSRDRLRPFCGVSVSLSLAMPFSRFYTRRLFDDMTRRPREGRASRNGNRCRLSHQSIRDLQMWRKLACTETYGRLIRLLSTSGIMHTDAADVGFDVTLDFEGKPGDSRQWQDQEIWEW
jgi:hypothetical protein